MSRTAPLLMAGFALQSLATTGCSDGPMKTGETITDRSAYLEVEVSIGNDLSSSADYQFSEIFDIEVTRDGKIWIIDGTRTQFSEPQSPIVRLYSAKGEFLRQVGRNGQGPGEYLAPSSVAELRDNRVVLRDYRNADVLLVYKPNGDLDASWKFLKPMHWPFGGRPIQADTGGSIWVPVRSRPGANQGGPSFVIIRHDGSIEDTVELPAPPEVEREKISIAESLPGGGVSVTGVSVPYQPIGQVILSPLRYFAFVRTDRYQIDVEKTSSTPGALDESRQLTPRIHKSIRRHVPAVPVADAERDAAADKINSELRRLGVSGRVRAPPIPKAKPPLRYIDYSDDGQLLVWISMPSRLQSGTWTESKAFDVFDRSGKFTGRIRMPDSLSFVGMNGDRLWGRHSGQNGLQSVRVYRIVWPSRD